MTRVGAWLLALLAAIFTLAMLAIHKNTNHDND